MAEQHLKTKATVLKIGAKLNTGRFIKLLSSDLGVIECFEARNKKQKQLAGFSCSLFSYGVFDLFYYRGQYRFNEFSLIHSFLELQKDISCYQAAVFMSELMHDLVVDAHQAQLVWELYLASLYQLECLVKQSSKTLAKHPFSPTNEHLLTKTNQQVALVDFNEPKEANAKQANSILDKPATFPQTTIARLNYIVAAFAIRALGESGYRPNLDSFLDSHIHVQQAVTEPKLLNQTVSQMRFDFAFDQGKLEICLPKFKQASSSKLEANAPFAAKNPNHAKRATYTNEQSLYQQHRQTVSIAFSEILHFMLTAPIKRLFQVEVSNKLAANCFKFAKQWLGYSLDKLYPQLSQLEQIQISTKTWQDLASDIAKRNTQLATQTPLIKAHQLATNADVSKQTREEAALNVVSKTKESNLNTQITKNNEAKQPHTFKQASPANLTIALPKEANNIKELEQTPSLKASLNLPNPLDKAVQAAKQQHYLKELLRAESLPEMDVAIQALPANLAKAKAKIHHANPTKSLTTEVKLEKPQTKKDQKEPAKPND